MGQVKVAHGFRNVPRFLRIKLNRLAFSNCAETAVARADIAAEHECGSAIGPAFKDVRTTSFLANGMQIQAIYELENIVLIRRIAEPDL
jgi:hypothetical protein